MAAEQSKFSGLRKKTEEANQRPAETSSKAKLSKNQRRMGRPPGKRSDPGYTQVTSHLNKESYYGAQSRLNHEKANGDFNGDLADVMDSLLAFYASYGMPWDLMED